MKKTVRCLAFILGACLVCGAVLPLGGCAKIKDAIRDAIVTEAPTEPPTEAPTPEPTPAPTEAPTPEPTEEPPAGPVLVNATGKTVGDIRICDTEAEDWGDVMIESISDGDEAAIDPALIPDEEGGYFDITFTDELGRQADFAAVHINNGSRVTLEYYDHLGQYETEDDEVCEYVITVLSDGGEERYEAVPCYPDEAGMLKLMLEKHSISRYAHMTDDLLLRKNYESVSLCFDSWQRYQHLAAALERDLGGDYADSLSDWADELAPDLEEYRASDPDSFAPMLSSRKLYVRRADKNALSILAVTAYEDGEGGFFFESFTYNTRRGRRLALSDVVTDVSRLPDLIAEQLEFREMPFEPDYLGDPAHYFSEERDEYAWTLDPTGLTIYFNGGAYEVNTVLIPYTDNEDLFGEAYEFDSEEYCMYFPELITQYMDLHGEGESSELRVGRIAPDENGMSDTLCIEYNGVEVNEPLETGGIMAWLVHSGGRNYLYVQGADRFGYGILAVFDINGRRPRLIMNERMKLPVTVHWYQNPELWALNGDYIELMTDPAYFRLLSVTDMLETAWGAKHYAVDGSGLPGTEEEFFTFTDPDMIIELRLIGTVTGTLIGDSGPGVTTVTYTAEELGDDNVFILIGTDNEDRILIAREGDTETMLAVEVERGEDGSLTIGDVPFDGIFEYEASVG